MCKAVMLALFSHSPHLCSQCSSPAAQAPTPATLLGVRVDVATVVAGIVGGVAFAAIALIIDSICCRAKSQMSLG
jgi:hypothetical protein